MNYTFTIDNNVFGTYYLCDDVLTELGYPDDAECNAQDYFDDPLKIKQKQHPDLYQRLYDLATGVDKCAWIYLKVERTCSNGTIKEIGRARISPIRDLNLEKICDCVIIVEPQPYILTDCLEENKDYCYNFFSHHVGSVLPSTVNNSTIINEIAGYGMFIDFNGNGVDITINGRPTNGLSTDFQNGDVFTVTQCKLNGTYSPISTLLDFENLFDKPTIFTPLNFDESYFENGGDLNVIVFDSSIGEYIFLKCVSFRIGCIDRFLSNYNDSTFKNSSCYFSYYLYVYQLEQYTGTGTPPNGYELFNGNYYRCPPAPQGLDAVRNGKDFNSAILGYFDNHPCKGEFYDCVRSHFFGFSSDNSHNAVACKANDEYVKECRNPYNVAQTFFRCMTLHSKGDVMLPNADPSRPEIFCLDYEKILEIFKIFNVYYNITNENGKRILNIEHKSKKALSNSYRTFEIPSFDLKTIVAEKHKRNFKKRATLAAVKTFEWMDEVSPPFTGQNIKYSGSCADTLKTDSCNITCFTTDIGAIQKNDEVLNDQGEKIYPFGNSISREGFVIVLNAKKNNGERIIINNNYELTWEYLHETLHTWCAPFWEAQINGKARQMCSVQNIFESEYYKMRYDCNNEIMIGDLVYTGNPIAYHPDKGYGWGTVSNLRFVEIAKGCYILFKISWGCPYSQS